MTGLVLVGASGLAKEVLALVGDTDTYDDRVVLDDDPATWGTDLAGTPVAGGIDELASYTGHAVVVCAGRGRDRQAIAARLSAAGLAPDRFERVVHPSVTVPPGCRIGRGSILLAQVVLTADVRLGRHVVVMPHATVTHDGVVADHATLCAGVSLGGGVQVGDSAYVGMNAAVRERVRVGAGSVLGMGSVLLRDLPDGATWAGNPAGPIARGIQLMEESA